MRASFLAPSAEFVQRSEPEAAKVHVLQRRMPKRDGLLLSVAAGPKREASIPNAVTDNRPVE
jgi:hypothetical protein